MSPRPRPAVAALDPYQPGISRREQNIKHRLASNESPLGPSPQAKEAYAKAVNDIARYPPEGLVTLREALAAKHALNPERIVCGSGSDELLSLLAYAYLNQGDVALHTQHGFLVYPIVIRAAGAQPIAVPERERKVDVNALLEAVTQNHPKAIFIANPGNPTGTHLTRHDLERLRDNIPETCLLIVDAAYAEFADAHDYDEGFDLADQAPNVAVLRTFSKAHGLAGLRVGWTYCSLDAADILNRLRSPSTSTPPPPPPRKHQPNPTSTSQTPSNSTPKDDKTSENDYSPSDSMPTPPKETSSSPDFPKTQPRLNPPPTKPTPSYENAESSHDEWTSTDSLKPYESQSPKTTPCETSPTPSRNSSPKARHTHESADVRSRRAHRNGTHRLIPRPSHAPKRTRENPRRMRRIRKDAKTTPRAQHRRRRRRRRRRRVRRRRSDRALRAPRTLRGNRPTNRKNPLAESHPHRRRIGQGGGDASAPTASSPSAPIRAGTSRRGDRILRARRRIRRTLRRTTMHPHTRQPRRPRRDRHRRTTLDRMRSRDVTHERRKTRRNSRRHKPRPPSHRLRARNLGEKKRRRHRKRRDRLLGGRI